MPNVAMRFLNRKKVSTPLFDNSSYKVNDEVFLLCLHSRRVRIIIVSIANIRVGVLVPLIASIQTYSQ